MCLSESNIQFGACSQSDHLGLEGILWLEEECKNHKAQCHQVEGESFED